MKRLFLCLIFILAVSGLSSCKKSESSSTYLSSDKSSEVSLEKSDDTTIVNDKLNLPFSDKFSGDWNMPGLSEKDGNVHKNSAIKEYSGKKIDVTDKAYGAVANDPNTDNYSAFKNAIIACGDGDYVYVPNGNYYFSSYSKTTGSYYTNIKLKANMALIGESMDGVKLISANDKTSNENKSTCVIAGIDIKNAAVKNLTVSSATEDSDLPKDVDSTSEQNFVWTAPTYGIVLGTGVTASSDEQQGSNCVVENCLIEKYQRMGVRLIMSSEMTVKNCIFQKATCMGPAGMGYGVDIQGKTHDIDAVDSFIDSKYNVIDSNKFLGPYIRHGVVVQYYSHNNLIINNTFDNTLLDSLDFHGEDEFSNEAYGNIIKNCRKGAGIGFGNTGATHDASGRLNYCHDNIISDCLRIADIALGTPDTILYKNSCSNADKGITASNANGTVIMDNTLSDISSDAINVTYFYNATNPSLGIPDNYRIEGNSIKSATRGIFIDSHTEDFICINNTFTDTDENFVDENSKFILPEKSNLMDKVDGTKILANENYYITKETPDSTPGSVKNLKLKSTYSEPEYNRMIYALFDKTSCPETYAHVYLSFTAKAQSGMPTINIYSNTTFVNWTSSTITWNNSPLHEDNVAVSKGDESNPLVKFNDFTFPVPGYAFNTYYIDVTDAYNAIDASYFTLLFVNDDVSEIYCEIYSSVQAGDQGLGLIFV